MTFQTREVSGADGQPVHLVKFSRPNKSWYLTSGDTDVMFDGQLYTAVPMSFTAIIQSGDAKSENMEITIPSSAIFCHYLDRLTPTEAIAVNIRKIHLIEDVADGTFSAPTVTDAPIMWVGEYISISRPTINSRKIVCNTISLSLNRGGLRQTWSRNCPHVLYGRGCLVDKSRFAVPLTNVQVLDGITISANEFGTEVTGGTTSNSISDPCNDLTSATGWRLGPYQTTASGYYSKVHVQPYGNPAPSFEILAESNLHSPAYAVKDFGTSGADTVNFQADVMIGDTGGSHFGSVVLLMGINAAGKGPRVQMHGTMGGETRIRIGTAADFDSDPEGSTDADVVVSGSLQGNQWYTLKGTRSGLGDSVAIHLSLYKGTTLLGSTSVIGTYETGGYFGPIRGKGDHIERCYMDNIVIQSSTTIASGSLAGGFIEWYSEPGVLERTGIETEDTVSGQVTVLGTTQGMENGTNFIAYLGCNRTAQMCDEVFQNILNFGGVNHMQGRSPFDGNPVF